MWTAPSGPCVRRLRNARINAAEVHYLNAHGTSTPLGDLNETNAIKLAFGDHAKKLVVNSTKSMTGHLLGGAGGIESVFTVLAVHHQISPPTINIFNQDPECDLDYCANQARPMKIDVAVKNNFGFGGTNGTLVFPALLSRARRACRQCAGHRRALVARLVRVLAGTGLGGTCRLGARAPGAA
jgi:3-oxoacyl-(acyl-carrier-protein) synthase